MGIHRPSGFRNGLQGVLEQVLVVGFKFDDAVFFKDLIVNRKEPVRGQPSLGVTVLGPRIREIQIDPIHLSGVKNVRQLQGINPHEVNVGQLQLGPLLEPP